MSSEQDGDKIVAAARSRIGAMRIAPCAGIASSQKAADELQAALDYLTASTTPALRSALEMARQEIVLALAFIGRDGGTDRFPETLKQLISRLGQADAAIRSMLYAPFLGGAKVASDIVQLVIAARNVAYEDHPDKDALLALDGAAEAFAALVPWDDEPTDGESTS